MTTAVLKTTGQAKRELSQRIRSIYKQELGHKVSDVVCDFFESRLTIVLEDSITKTEKQLIDSGDVQLANQVHSNLTQMLETKIKATVEDIVQVEVIDVLSSVTLKTGRTGMVVVLAEEPHLRK